MPILLPLLIALPASALLCWLLLWLSPRLGFIDQPGSQSHKMQKRAVPYGGGVAMALALTAALLATCFSGHGQLDQPVLVILLVAGGLFLLGLIDDIKPLNPRWKLIIQGVLVALAVGLADLSVDLVHGWTWLAAFLAFWWCLVLTNAYNLMDHADGMSGSIAVVSMVVLLATSLLNNDDSMAMVWLALIGCLVGFLIWNLPPAKIYMGDAGSLPLGFLIGAGSIHLTFWFSGKADSNPLAVATPLLIAMLPIYDMLVVLVKRHRLQRPLMTGDRNHISHRLSRLGLSARKGLAAAVALQIALASGALMLRHSDVLTGIVVLCQALALCLVAALLEANRDRAI
ncbi:MAG: undecaprenyl/decaprenyl-phosphate alpha-N-acetylglucosaminyl 1-phosphate transferase [Planctomycetota bacterium]|nr:MAG: undecaprenyl/decaprenyl-phosphate alpha-N-acetylglucosaminyl 1-phosphate transferase [Planctomycetota bacterium]